MGEMDNWYDPLPLGPPPPISFYWKMKGKIGAGVREKSLLKMNSY